MNIISSIAKKNKKRNISKLFLVMLILFLLLAIFIQTVLGTDIRTTHTTINCASDRQCGKTGFIGHKFCSDTSVFQDYQNSICINPRTPQSYCQIQKTSKIISDCGVSSCSAYGKTFCNGNAVYRDNICTLRGCKSGSCFSDNYKNATLVELCPNGCEKGECKIKCKTNNDCGQTGFFGNEFCSNNNVFKLYQSSVCVKPGTPKSYCEIQKTSKMIFDCGVSECSAIGVKFCNGNIVYQNQTCTIRGCDSGACFSRSSSPQVVAIKECLDKEICINGDCVCNPKMVTSYSDWINISYVNNLLNQSRIKTKYDSHNCGTVANITIIEYRIIDICNHCNHTCSPNWQCTTWSACSNRYQNRTCNDNSNCNNSTGKPAESQSCSSGGCVPFWDCSDWSSCSGGYRDRTCTDLYNCNWNFGKPDETEECSSRHYSSDYGSISYSNNLVQLGAEKEPMISIKDVDQTQEIVHLESNKINSPTGASVGVSGNSNIFIILFIVALILVVFLIVLAILFRR